VNPAEIAAAVLGVPQQTICSAERIKGGLTNESWIVRTPNESVVVRLSTADEQALQIDRHSETIMLALAAKAGIGAEVLISAPERRLLVTRYLPGNTWTAEDARKPRNIQRIARVLRELHRLEARAVHFTDLRMTVEGYVRTLEERNQTANLSNAEVQQALDIASRGVRDLQPVLCHNDVHHLNVIDDGGRLWLIDWEYAGLGNPLFDLAAICCYHHYEPELRRTLAECYWGHSNAAQLATLDEMCWLFDYIKALWFEVRAHDAL
jgi:thiamine kinase